MATLVLADGRDFAHLRWFSCYLNVLGEKSIFCLTGEKALASLDIVHGIPKNCPAMVDCHSIQHGLASDAIDRVDMGRFRIALLCE